MLKIIYTFTGAAHHAYVAAYLEKLDTGWTLARLDSNYRLSLAEQRATAEQLRDAIAKATDATA